MKKYLCLAIIIALVTGCTMVLQQQTERPAKSEESVLIGLTGDVMLGRLVDEQITKTSYTYPWGDVLPLLKDNDINIMNLETTLTTSEKIVPKVFNYKATPDKVQSLVEARIDVVNLANNHILDFAEEGMLETIAVLDEAGIKHVGAGKNKQEASRPVIIKRKGITIGLIGYTDNEPTWEAAEQKLGTNYAEIGNKEKLQEIIAEIKELREEVDILIFTIHWGPNMRQKPTQQFQDFAHAVLEAGADIFHGHSAHIFQGIEIYNKKLILYDTGDFVDDYYVAPSLRNDQSFLYLVEIGKEGLREIRLVPVLISNMQVNKARGSNYKETVDRVKDLSEEFGTKIIETGDGLFVELK